jgi:tetratricopeptide (TPR) repeat protein
MKKWPTLMAAVAFITALSGPMASIGMGAAGASAGPAINAAAAQDDAKKAEADAYKGWYDAFTAKDTKKALDLAQAYLDKFPSGDHADYLKKWIVATRAGLFNAALNSKNTDDMIRIAEEVLSKEPDNLDYIYIIAVSIRQNELFASPPNFSHAAQAEDYSNRAIRLIEGGKVPAAVPKDKWNKNVTLSLLYQNLAVIAANKKDTDKALANYEKSLSLDPSNAFDYLACGSLRQIKYQDAVSKFNQIPEADRNAAEPKPEVKSALDEVNKQADSVIDSWAHFMALTAGANPFGATRGQVGKALEDLYKFRHPDAPDGLQKLIDQYKAGASSSSTPSGAGSAA